MFDSENTNDLSGIIMPKFDVLQSKKIETEYESNSIAKQISIVFSASGISAMMSHPEMDSLPTAGQQYVQRKFENRKTGTFNSFSTKATEHGNKFESLAIETFTKITDVAVSHTGDNQICLTYGENCVAHPDGIVEDLLNQIIATVEVKCPYNREIHESYLQIIDAQSLKEVASNYYWQVCAQQLFSGANKSYFVSFDPKPNDGIPRLHYATIVIPTDDIEFMKKAGIKKTR